MNEEIAKRIREVTDSGNFEIHIQVSKLRNIILAGEHAATYAEEQENMPHKPPNWPIIFQTLGELTEGIRKTADDVLNTIFAELDKSTTGGTRNE
jgi:hypothetical protein